MEREGDTCDSIRGEGKRETERELSVYDSIEGLGSSDGLTSEDECRRFPFATSKD